MTYSVGLIGAGNIAAGYDDSSSPAVLTHAHAVRSMEAFSLGGFYDIDADRACEAARKWECRTYDSIDQLAFENDIVVVAVPDRFHADVLRKILPIRSIRAIITEKPLASNREEGEEILAGRHSDGPPVFVNYSRRYIPAFQELRRWIDERGGRFLHGGCYYGKGLAHNGSHMIDLMRDLLGELTLHAVDGAIYDHIKEDPSVRVSFGAVDRGDSLVYFHPIPSDVVTVFDFELFFEGGKIRYSGEENTIRYEEISFSEVYQGEKNYREVRCVDLRSQSAMIGLYENVSGVLEGREIVRCSIEDALETLKLCEDVRHTLSVS